MQMLVLVFIWLPQQDSGSVEVVHRSKLSTFAEPLQGSMVALKFLSITLVVPICPGYSYYYRGRCYFSVYGLGYSDAASQCSDDCGQLASIHTLGVSIADIIPT